MRKWTEGEILFLQINAGKLSAKEIASVLTRTENSVAHKANKLDISFNLSPEEQLSNKQKYKAQWFQNNKQRILDKRKLNPVAAEQAALYNLKYHYNLSKENYEALLKLQNHKCAICGKLNSTTRAGKLRVDHDHVTGIVRGLLCLKCNAGIGLLKDDIKLLENAIYYLLKGERNEEISYN